MALPIKERRKKHRRKEDDIPFYELILEPPIADKEFNIEAGSPLEQPESPQESPQDEVVKKIMTCTKILFFISITVILFIVLVLQ